MGSPKFWPKSPTSKSSTDHLLIIHLSFTDNFELGGFRGHEMIGFLVSGKFQKFLAGNEEIWSWVGLRGAGSAQKPSKPILLVDYWSFSTGHLLVDLPDLGFYEVLEVTK